MAIIENGVNGGFRGKVGSVTGYYSNGKWIIRGLRKSTPKNKKGSTKQRASRSRFTIMQQFLSPVTYFIRVGFNMESRKRLMTAHNVAKSYNMLEAQLPDGSIDYAKVSMSFGDLIGVESPAVQVIDNQLHFTWVDNAPTDFERGLDQVMILAYDVNTGITYAEMGGAKRKKCEETLTLDELQAGESFHVWMCFISNDRVDISMSTYCGVFDF